MLLQARRYLLVLIHLQIRDNGYGCKRFLRSRSQPSPNGEFSPSSCCWQERRFCTPALRKSGVTGPINKNKNEYRQSRFATVVAVAIALPGLILALEGHVEGSIGNLVLGGGCFGGIMAWLVVWGARTVIVTDEAGLLVKKGVFRRRIPYENFVRADTKLEGGRHTAFMMVLTYKEKALRKRLRFAVKSFSLEDLRGLVADISDNSPKFILGRDADELLYRGPRADDPGARRR